MKDVVAVLLMLGAFVGVWFWIARKLRKKGAGGFVRHLAGGVCGVGAFFVAGIFAAAVGLIEPESSDSSAKTADAESADQEDVAPEASAIEASEAETLVAQPAEEDTSASEAPEGAEAAANSASSEAAVADRREEIQSGSDLGIDVETFTARFNNAMASIELPFRARGNAPDLEDSHVQRIFTESFNDHLAVMVGVKPYSDDIRDLTFIGSGDGTVESGLNVMMTAASVFSATQEAWPVRDAVSMVTEMSDEVTAQGDRVTRTLNGLEYSYRRDSMFGNMFSVSPTD